MQLEYLLAEARTAFEQHYGQAPRWIAGAPGRVNLIGEHTDYNDGYVFPMALERYTVVLGVPRHDPRVRIISLADPHPLEVSLDKPLEPRSKGFWGNYPLGVMAGFLERGYRVPGLNLLIHSSVPLGGGVSSSAALEVAMATLLEAAMAVRLEPVEKALLCQQAEHRYAGMPCGIMDQFIAVLAQPGHALLLDCRSRCFQQVPMLDSDVTVLVINTQVRHTLTGSEYPTRRRQCEEAARIMKLPALRDATLADLESARSRLDPTVYRRARHVIGEIQRTLEAAEAFRDGNWLRAGELMYASHASLRDDYEVSCRELDVVVEAARAIGPDAGVYGCRMTGGGFGGCAVALVRTAAVSEVQQRLARAYWQQTGREAVMFVSRPGRGAWVIHGA
ncbi:MAG: galactokinase [Verrucomicrobiota bacterium]|nr:galactokinase [Limisphaera sp.]MDW8380648.1 galactokinase [Verrucomicrobiota bacterium]